MISLNQHGKRTIRMRILESAKNLNRWFTAQEMAELLHGNRNTIRGNLADMYVDGDMERGDLHRTSKFNKTYLYRASFKKPAEPKPQALSKNIFQAILQSGHDEDFAHKPATEATGAIPGSREKVEVMRRRVEMGQNPCHPQDVRGTKLGPEPSGNYKCESGIGNIREFTMTQWRR